MRAKVRVLWLSDSPTLATGFGRVTREITRRLAGHPRIDVACVACGFAGIVTPEQVERIRFYPAAGMASVPIAVEGAVADFKPDLVVTLGELRMLQWLAGHPVRKRFKWVAYVPLDAGPFYPPWGSVLSEVQEIVAMSDFGRGILISGLNGRRVRTISHGVDTDCFKPLRGRSDIKKHPRFEGKFVVGCVARNQARKNLPALIIAFADLAKRYPNLHLYVHATPSDEGYDLVNLFKRFGLRGRADLASASLSLCQALSDSQLNTLYNLFDVMVLPTCAEGFGLPILESLAAGVPVVATDFSACRELVSGRGELAKVLTTLISAGNGLEQAIVDVDDLARCIEKLYLNPELRAEYGRAGRAFAESLSWDRLLPQWLEVLSSVSGVDLTEAVDQPDAPPANA